MTRRPPTTNGWEESVFKARPLECFIGGFQWKKNQIRRLHFVYGLWEFTIMPYGLTGATQACQWALDHVLKCSKKCIDNYVDDLIVFSDDMESHITNLHQVLLKLWAAGFKPSRSRDVCGSTKAVHLGFGSSAGVAPSSEKTKAEQDWPISSCSKYVRFFLGLVNFFRRVISHFANVAHPLTTLTSKNTDCVWKSKNRVPLQLWNSPCWLHHC